MDPSQFSTMQANSWAKQSRSATSTRKVMLSFDEQSKLTITERNFWSTKDFVEYHYSNLLTLFLAIVERCIQIERRDLIEPIPVPADAKKELIMFPTRPTEKMTVEKMKVKFPKSMVDW